VIYFASTPGETILAELPDAPPELLVRGTKTAIRWRITDTLTYPLS
jgi:hypothetical protein